MEVCSILNTGLVGYWRAQDVVVDAALTIAQANNKAQDVDLHRSLIQLHVGEENAQAAAKVIKVADEVIGTLLDVKV